MTKRSFALVSLAAGLVLALFLVLSASSAAWEAGPDRTPGQDAWLGTWQMGPNLDTTILGCPAGNGLARHAGYYYEAQNRVYFLGGRCENNTTTTGSVFYFDPDTRTYAATGAVLPVPISNYTIGVLNDGLGHGPGLYTVGGRTAAGGQSNAVQVYYPDDNTVAQIATDPFPAPVLYSPGAVVAANNKLYVIGGFDGTNMYATTWVYDPAAAAGSRWSNASCDLPTARSYIAGVAIGNLVYAIGGDEYSGGLIPLDDTLVLDVNNMAACWQDGAMADLPEANGDAPAVYVDPGEGYLGGGIYVIGGYWPSPGPYSWVFRYDVAGDLWESFPELTIPDPATGRRNQAAAYIPAGAKGLGNGVPGIWTFGGYDGSGTNAMTESSEFFSIESGPVLVLPEQVEWAGPGGGSVDAGFVLVNLSGATDTFDLSYTADVTWTATLPASLGPVPDGGEAPFVLNVQLPASVPCPATGEFIVTAVAQSSPVISDSQAIQVRIICAVAGTVRDATTGQPLADAYVWVQDAPDGLGDYYDAFTDANGNYTMADVPPGTWYFGADARYFQPSFYPAGWPAGAIMVDHLAGYSTLVNVDLVGSQLAWSPAGLSVTASPGEVLVETLTLTNTGTGPLAFNLSELPPGINPPPAISQGESAKPRIDEQLLSDLAAAPDGKADMLVVLPDQANLDRAESISDWQARGQYVLRTLQKHAEQSQKGLISFLDGRGASYRSLYIINAVIVRGGDRALVDSLAARPDVATIQANHRIAVPEPLGPVYDSPTSPDAVEWNIAKVNADDVWGLGFTGQGMVVAEIDTGTQYDHPALVGKYRGNLGGGSFDHNFNWYDPYEQCPSAGDVPCDGAQHGTHVMGTMVGDDGGTNQIGMAPGAKWISCKGGDAVSGYLLTNELLLCAQWILAPWDLNDQNANPAMRPHVVNNSWGGGPNDYWYSGAVSAWRAAGIFPAIATGNAGPACSSAHSPGDYWNSFGVGATDVNDLIASFSGRGPAVATGILKPDITAPGVNIRSSIPGSSYAGGWNGTSMATPHVAGAVALLWSADPELVGQVDTSSWLLQRTALAKTTTEGCGGDGPTDVPNNTFGYGRLDILAAVQAALGEQDDLPWLDVDPASGTILPGLEATLPVQLTFTAPATLGVYTGTLWLVADDPYNQDVRIPVQLNVVETHFYYLPIIAKNY